MQALHRIMQDNLSIENLQINRFGLCTWLTHKCCVRKWVVERSSLSAEGRFHHKSIHFLCVFNRLGRGKFVRQAHSGMGVPGVSAPNTNQLITTIGAIQHTDSEIHLSCVYGFLRANPAIIHQSSLPPPDSVARRAIHYDRDCKTHLSIRSCKRRRRL